MMTTSTLLAENQMGEIRVKVLLTNGVDESLARSGKLSHAEVRRYEANAVVDTGAVTSVLPVYVAETLGLISDRRAVAELADGSKVNVEVVDPVRFEIFGRKTIDEAFVLGDEVLIGQTILEKLDLLADAWNNRLIPNPEHPDQPVLKLR
jgi:clan AA aspartic protease